jgi:hypothetical protein
MQEPNGTHAEDAVLKQRSAQDQGSDGEIDQQSRDVDQGRDERRRSAGRVEPGPLQDEREHRSGQRAEHDDADQGGGTVSAISVQCSP